MSQSEEVNIQQKEMAQEESWTQTSITVSPEDSPVLREIKNTTKISANIKIPSDIYVEDFVYRLVLKRKDVIDHKELEQESTKDVQSQTFLQGVPVVVIPIEYKNEASQTMYMRSPCPPVKPVEKIIASMNRPMPVMKINCSIQTTVSIVPRTSLHSATESLLTVTHEKSSETKDSINEEMIIREIFEFLLSLVFWISDPAFDQVPIETKYQETQTIIRYDFNTDNIVMDNETQTKLTCEPRHSNSKLLADYEETKHFMQNCLQKCLEGVEPRIIIDDLFDEIIMKGADRFKYPMKNQVTQTVTSCKSHEETDEDVLRKLRTPVVVDPFEASIVVVPLISDLLSLVCDEVSRDARCIVKNILGSLFQHAVSIGYKLAKILQRPQPKSMEQIFDERRKKITASILKREKETTATQTGFAGVPEIALIKETRDVLCSVCARQSTCQWCTATQEDLPPKKDTKILRTQDILLAYKPCYVVATASEEARNPHLQSIGLTKKKIEERTIQLPTSCCITSEDTYRVPDKTINVLMTPKRKIQAQDSVSGWTHIIDDTLAKSWSLKDTTSNATNVTTTNSTRSFPKSNCKKSIQSESILSLQETKALQILKNAFCTSEICSILTTSRKHHISNQSANEEDTSCDIKNCPLLNLDQYHKRPINNDDSVYAGPRIDKFRNAVNTSNVTTTNSTRSFPKSKYKKSSQSDSLLSLQETKALELLKNAFGTSEICPALATSRKDDISSQNASKDTFCNIKNCPLLNLNQYPRQPINNDGPVCTKP